LDNEKLDELMSRKITEIEEIDSKLYSEMLEFAEKVKVDMFSFIYIPWWTVGLLATFASVLVLYILVQYSEGLEQYVLLNQYWRFIGELWGILMLYGFAFLGLMFCWWNWSISMRGGYTWRLCSTLLALKIFDSVKSPLPHHSKSTKIAQSLIYNNESINLLVIFLTSCFPDVLSGFDGLYVIPEISTLMILYGVHWYFSNVVCSQHRICRNDKIVSPSRARIEQFVISLSVVMMSVYDWTSSSNSKSFFIGSIHISGLVIYGLSFIILPIYFVWNRRTRDLIIPINLLLMFLHRDSLFERMFILLMNYQFLVNILPLMELVRIRFTEIMSSQKVSTVFLSFTFTNFSLTFLFLFPIFSLNIERYVCCFTFHKYCVSVYWMLLSYSMLLYFLFRSK
jgi:hypothetical protein